jgi:organic hydroperoxide reductase OsmC/OhrA
MSEHQARIRWARRPGETFIDSRYSRAHTWQFDGGVTVPASSAVSSVPLPFSKAENVDPEEGFVAAVSSCHMLTFLYLAAKEKWVVDSYDDEAVGRMARNAQGRLAITLVRLRPHIVFAGAARPDEACVHRLHRAAHEECYVANSVNSQIEIVGSWSHAAGPEPV